MKMKVDLNNFGKVLGGIGMCIYVCLYEARDRFHASTFVPYSMACINISSDGIEIETVFSTYSILWFFTHKQVDFVKRAVNDI